MDVKEFGFGEQNWNFVIVGNVRAGNWNWKYTTNYTYNTGAKVYTCRIQR